MKIFLDPGHGGRDPGAVGPTGLREKDVVLAVAFHAKDALARAGHSEVVLSRDVDVLPAWQERRTRNGASCFVSIHCNGAEIASANGTETYYFSDGHPQSATLARSLQGQLLFSLGRRDRGVKTGGFRVLRQVLCPAALVELAFITNQTEEVFLSLSATQEQAGMAIAHGIVQFLQGQSSRTTHTVAAFETLFSIARQHYVSVDQIRAWNGLTSTVIHPGQKLFVSE